MDAPPATIILLLSVDYVTSLRARPHHLAEFLLRKGTDVVVVFPRLLPPFGGASRLHKAWRFIRFILRERLVEVGSDRRLKTIGIMPLPLKAWLAPLQIGWLAVWSWLQLRHEDRSIVVSEGPLGGAVGSTLRKLRLVRTHIYEDLDYFAGFYHGSDARMIEAIESWIVRSADGIVVVSQELKALREGKARRAPLVVPNGVDLRLFGASPDCPATAEPILIFVGAIESWTGVEFSLRALAIVARTLPGVRYLIVGPGDTDRLRKLASVMAIEEHTILLGPKAKTELPHILRQARVGLAPFEPSLLMHYAFTLKVIEYMAAGLPVIGTDIGATGRVIKESGAGIACRHDVAEFARAIENVLTDDHRYAEMRRNALRYAQQYDWEQLLEPEWKFILDTRR